MITRALLKSERTPESRFYDLRYSSASGTKQLLNQLTKIEAVTQAFLLKREKTGNWALFLFFNAWILQPVNY